MLVQDFYSSQQQPWITKLKSKKSPVSLILGPSNTIQTDTNIAVKYNKSKRL
jgi:hypothetical protein